MKPQSSKSIKSDVLHVLWLNCNKLSVQTEWFLWEMHWYFPFLWSLRLYIEACGHSRIKIVTNLHVRTKEHNSSAMFVCYVARPCCSLYGKPLYLTSCWWRIKGYVTGISWIVLNLEEGNLTGAKHYLWTSKGRKQTTPIKGGET